MPRPGLNQRNYCDAIIRIESQCVFIEKQYYDLEGWLRLSPPPPSSGVMAENPVSSPCIQICAVSGQSGLCIGCGRTLKEIAAWPSLDEPARKAIMAELPARLARLAEAAR
jgi:predicted Fe-S protein YdhL (DUF1289 family)